MGDKSKGSHGGGPIGEHDELKERASRGELTPKEHFRRVANVGALLAYDLIDKLRHWEKETLELTDDEIAGRLDHLTRSVEDLRAAYLAFAELDS